MPSKKTLEPKKNTTGIAIAVVVIVIVALLAIVIIPSFFQPNTIEIGDCIEVEYTGKFVVNGTVFTTTYNDTVNKTGGTPQKLFVNPDMNLSVPSECGASSVLKLVPQEAIRGLIGMKEGVTKNITLSPEEAYGDWNTTLWAELFEQYFGVPYYPRYTYQNFINTVTRSAFITLLNSINSDIDYSSGLALNQTFLYLTGKSPSGEDALWQMKIINLSDENVTFQNIVSNGTIFNAGLWNSTIIVDNETSFRKREDPKIGEIYTQIDENIGIIFIKIIDVNETGIIIAGNAQAPSIDFIGQNLVYECKIVSISKTAHAKS